MQIVVSGGVLQMDFRTDFYNRSAWGGFDFCADAIVAAHEEATRLKAEWTKKGYDVPPPNMLGCNNPDPGTWKISDSD
jgi:hypothetical protein